MTTWHVNMLRDQLAEDAANALPHTSTPGIFEANSASYAKVQSVFAGKLYKMAFDDCAEYVARPLAEALLKIGSKEAKEALIKYWTGV